MSEIVRSDLLDVHPAEVSEYLVGIFGRRPIFTSPTRDGLLISVPDLDEVELIEALDGFEPRTRGYQGTPREAFDPGVPDHVAQAIERVRDRAEQGDQTAADLLTLIEHVKSRL